jgi:hypothetical protein
MQLLFGQLLFSTDFLFAPLCFIVLLMIFSIIINKYKDDSQRKLFLKAFYVKMTATLLYTAVMSFYYKGGDTEMYYECTQNLRQAVLDDSDNFIRIYMTKMINVKTPLMNYFIFNDSPYPNFEAMHSPGNFFVPKLALPFALLFSNSYLCMAMGFSLFALGGMMRLYKFFIYYFPDYWREIALGTLFLPSLVFWSSGLMKDPITLGSVGYLVYAVFNIFILKKKIIYSLLWGTLSVIFLLFIKPYILLALAPGVMLWIFSEINKRVENKTLRNIMAIITFTIGAGIGALLVNVATSDESLKQYSVDNFVETSEYNRSIYEDISTREGGSYFAIKTQSPVLLVLIGISAVLFRPFLWEVNSPTALFSALESLAFLVLTAFIMYKSGFFTFFKKVFGHPVFMMCFVFTIIFAAAVGSTASNFGSISRYKIPCLPFYIIMLLVMYRQSGYEYPNWFKKLLGYPVIYKSQKTLQKPSR